MEFPVTHALFAGLELTEDEAALVEAVSKGQAWFGSDDPPTPKQLTEAEFVAQMPAIRAVVVRALCLGYRLTDAPVDPRGIDIYGARIVGKLDLSFATVPVKLGLFHCHFSERPDLMQAHFPLLGLSRSRLEQGLLADGLKLDGSLFCRGGFHATGEVRLLGAAIGGNAEFDGATLSNVGGKALWADGIKITGGLLCRGDFKITGAADLTAARIEKWFEWAPKEWNGLLDLSHVFAGQWKDHWAGDGWDAEGEPEIDLKTFTYDALATTNSHNDAASRIAWIRASLGEENFAPGPYETLTRALRADGDDGGANDVAYAKRVDRAKHRARPEVTPDWRRRIGRRLIDGVFNLTAGHGYKPWRGVGWLVGFLLFGWLCFGWNGPMAPNGSGNGVIKPAVPVIFGSVLGRCGYDVKASDGKCSAPIAYNDSLPSHVIHYALPIEYTPFSPFWYTLDTLIPLVDLGQESAWSPSPINSSICEDFWGWLVLGYLYVHIIFGWILTTLTVVALSGIIKKD